MYHTTDATALSAAECLLKHFGHFGEPHQLRSNNGPHFIADVIREFLHLIGVSHCLTLAYSKQENSIVLKISASQMLFGNMLNLDKGIFIPQSEPSSASKPLSKYMSDLLAVQDNLLKASAEELLRTDLLHMTTKDQNIHKEYLPDSYVLHHYRTCLLPTHLHTNWKGPMRVIKGLYSHYTLLDLITGKEKDYHVSDMKPFVFDSALVDPLDIARYRGKLSHRNSVQLFVSWMGYDQSYDSC